MFMKDGQRIDLSQGLRLVTGYDEQIDEAGNVVATVPVTTFYPAESLMNASLQAELGITEVPDLPRPDERRFFVTQNEDGTFNTTPRPLEQVTQPMWERIQARRDAISAGGVQVGGYWFHTDLDSRIRYVGLLRITDAMKAMGAIGTDTVVNPATNATVLWKIMDGSRVPLTLNMVDAIFAAVTLLDMSAFESAELHRAAMEAMANPFEYNMQAGWPATWVDAI